MIRFIGRRAIDESPSKRLKNGCAAKIPLSIRMVDPEFPTSNVFSGTE